MTKIKDMTKEELRLYWATKKMESRLKAAIPDSEEDTIETETSIRLWLDARKAHAEGTRLGRKKRAKPLRPSELRARRLMKAIISDPAHPGFMGPILEDMGPTMQIGTVDPLADPAAVNV